MAEAVEQFSRGFDDADVRDLGRVFLCPSASASWMRIPDGWIAHVVPCSATVDHELMRPFCPALSVRTAYVVLGPSAFPAGQACTLSFPNAQTCCNRVKHLTHQAQRRGPSPAPPSRTAPSLAVLPVSSGSEIETGLLAPTRQVEVILYKVLVDLAEVVVAR